jgi:hypothetical protein
MKNKRSATLVVSLTLGIGALVGHSVDRARAAGIPATQAMTYSGVLTNAAGAPLTGSKNIQIQIYDMASGGTVQCTVGPTAIELVNGGFSVVLPDTCTTVVHATPDLWIEVFADGASLGRTKLGAVPFAVEADHANGAAGPLAQQVVPSGAVMFFNLAACPSGWVDAAAAQGRYLVGMPPSGTLAGTVGTALTNGENRAVGQHTHSVSDPGHAHGVSDPGHAHGVGAGTAYVFWNGSTCAGNVGSFQSAPANCLDAANATGAAATGVTVNASPTNIGLGSAGAVPGTNAPYIQFRICQKS